MYKIYTGIDYTDQHNYPNASVQIHRSFFLSIKACKRNSEEYMGKYLTISYIEHTKYQSTKKKIIKKQLYGACLNAISCLKLAS